MIGPFAAGSLAVGVHPGDLVVVDQLVDRTWGRADTYHDEFTDGPVHVSLADPYDPDLRAALVAGATKLDSPSTTAAPSSSSRAPASPPAPSRPTTAPRAGR